VPETRSFRPCCTRGWRVQVSQPPEKLPHREILVPHRHNCHATPGRGYGPGRRDPRPGRRPARRGASSPTGCPPIPARGFCIFTNSGSWGNISGIVRRQTGTRERENGAIVRCSAAWGGYDFPIPIRFLPNTTRFTAVRPGCTIAPRSKGGCELPKGFEQHFGQFINQGGLKCHK